MEGERTPRYVVVVRDRRGRGLRRYFGPFETEGQEVVDEINECSRRLGPRLPGGDVPAVSAALAWLHPPRAARARELIDGAPPTGDGASGSGGQPA